MDRNVMTRVRHLNPVPDPSMHPPEDLRERITAQPHEGRRVPPRQRRRRTVMAAVALPATAAVAIMAVVAINARQQTSDPLAALPAARVSYGLDVPVTLRPDPEVSLPEMKERLREALAQRAQQMDAAGITVRDIDENRVMVRLPGVQGASEAAEFLSFPRIQLLDEARSVLATATTLDGLRSAVRALPPTPDGSTVIYAQPLGGANRPTSAPIRLATSRAPGMIRSLQESSTSKEGLPTVEVPADVFILGDRQINPTKLFLVRPTSLVPLAAVHRLVDANPIAPAPSSRYVTLTIDATTPLPSSRTPVMAIHRGGPDEFEDPTTILARDVVDATHRDLALTVDPTLRHLERRVPPPPRPRRGHHRRRRNFVGNATVHRGDVHHPTTMGRWDDQQRNALAPHREPDPTRRRANLQY